MSVIPRAPPQCGTNLLGIPGKGNGRFPGLVMLDLATLPPIGCQSKLGPGMEQLKKRKIGPCSGILTFNPFPTTPVLIYLGGVAEGGAMTWWHHSGHLSWIDSVSSPHVLLRTLKNEAGDGLEKWRKIGDHKEDLQGIPACEAEIGNWAVVITGCGIDVVPINQNCWINKNCSRFFFFFFFFLPWQCPKNVSNS